MGNIYFLQAAYDLKSIIFNVPDFTEGLLNNPFNYFLQTCHLSSADIFPIGCLGKTDLRAHPLFKYPHGLYVTAINHDLLLPSRR